MLVTNPSARLLLALTVLSFGGCSSGDSSLPARVPVTGTVLLNGTPLSGATVQFEGPSGVRPGVGLTDEAGRFQISSYGERDGLPPGEYQISVSKWESTDASASDTSMEAIAAQGSKPQAPPKLLVPQRYTDTFQSGLKETVQEGSANDFKLELTE